MAKVWVAIVGLCLFLGSCTSESATYRAIHHASNSWNDALRVVDKAYHDSPMVIQMRRFSCLCDPQLQYEAHIYGSWHPVLVVGDEEKLRELQKRVNSVPEGMATETSVLLTDKIYASTSGLLFFTLYYVGNAG